MKGIVNIQIKDKDKDKLVEIHTDKLRIMGNSNNNNMLNKQLPMDNMLNKLHTNKAMPNKVMPNKVMPNKAMLIHMGSKDMVVPTDKWELKVVNYHLPERNKCHTMELLHNHNLTDQPDKRIHQRM